MSNRWASMNGAAAIAIAIAWLSSPVAAGGQAGPPAPAGSSTAKPAQRPGAGSIPRTADGHPDLRGVWAKVGGELNEAKAPPTPLGEGEDAFGANAEPAGFSNVTTDRAKVSPDVCFGPACRRGGQGPSRRTGVIDPPDRVLPWRPEADAERRAFNLKTNPAASWYHLEPNARCAPPAPWAGLPPKYSNAVQFLQHPDEIVMMFEDDHASRSIHLDGRPHPGPMLRFFMGHATGRWEGNTLVVDTTNLNGKNEFGRAFLYYSDAMHLTERFTMADADTIDYEIVYDDPKLFTRPIKSGGYFKRGFKDYEIREDSCAEGSHTLEIIFGF